MELVPYVRFAMSHIWLDGYFIDRVIWDHEFIFIEKGSLKITINGNQYIAKENDLVILRPNERHQIEYNGESCHQPHVHFDFVKDSFSENIGISMLTNQQMSKDDLNKFREDFFTKNNIDIPDIIHLKEPRIFYNKLNEIIDEYTYHKPESPIILQGLMTELIGYVLRENAKLNSINTNNILNDTITYMNESVDNNLTLDDFVLKANTSKWTLIQTFNEIYQMSPMKYYNKIRYLRAKDLILNSMSSIADISYRMGFNEPQTFSRWFKNIDGNFPTYYRKLKN